MSLNQILAKSVSKSIEQDFWSACKKDRHGNPIVISNYMMRVFAFVTLPLGIAVLFICIFFLTPMCWRTLILRIFRLLCIAYPSF
jgi:hypothetical protein